MFIFALQHYILHAYAHPVKNCALATAVLTYPSHCIKINSSVSN